jgi:hypothetical protein
MQLTFYTCRSGSKRGYHRVLFSNHDRAAIARVSGTTLGSLSTQLAVRNACLIANHGAAGSLNWHSRSEHFPFWTKKCIAAGVEVTVLWQEGVRHATARKSLSHSAIRSNGSCEHRDTALVQCQHVFTAGVAGIDHHLFWTSAGSGVGGYLYVVTKRARCARVSHSPSFWIRNTRSGLPFALTVVPGRLARSIFSYSLRACATLCSRSRWARSRALAHLGSGSSAGCGSPIRATCSRAIFKCASIRFLVQNELLPAFA